MGKIILIVGILAVLVTVPILFCYFEQRKVTRTPDKGLLKVIRPFLILGIVCFVIGKTFL